MCRDRGTITDLALASCRMRGKGWRDGVLARALCCWLKSQNADHTETLLQPYGGEPKTPEVAEANKETPENDLTGGKWPVGRQHGQSKCLYSRACSVGNKQEELEATTRLESYVLAAVTEAWWDESPDWSAAVDGGQGRKRNGRVALYIEKQIECDEPSLKNHLWTEEQKWAGNSLCVRNRDWGNKGNLVDGVTTGPWPRVTYWWDLLVPPTGRITLTGSCPAGRLQPPQCLLEKWQSKL